MNYDQTLRTLAKRFGKRAVKTFADKGISVNYCELEKYSRKLCAWLQLRGVRPGDRIAVWMGNVPEFMLLAAASLRLGTVLVPVSAYEAAAEVQRICDECQCEYLFCDGKNKHISKQLKGHGFKVANVIDLGRHEQNETFRLSFIGELKTERFEPCEIAPDDSIVISFSSGSTGEKKGIKKSMRSYFGEKGFSGLYKRTLSLVNTLYPIRLYSLFPWCHNTGLTLLLVSLLGGRFQEITCEQYNPVQTLHAMEQYRPNLWMGTATMLYRCCSLRETGKMYVPAFIISTGEAIPWYIIDKIGQYSKGRYLFSGYGTTEVGSIAQIVFRLGRPSAGQRLLARLVQLCGVVDAVHCVEEFADTPDHAILGSIHSGAEVKIFHEENGEVLPDSEIGEICAYKKSRMNGYLNEKDEQSFLQYEGKHFFRTGDMGYRKNGLLFLAGRKKNLIIRSGMKIVPGSIERVALGCKGVAAAIACGVPSRDRGEDICLCLQTGPAYSEAQLWLELEKQLPKYSLPAHLLYWEEFPVGATGKTDRKTVQQEAEARLSAN